MFHWICPECGREIAPTIRECPVCDPVAATVETALAGEVEAPARAGNEAAAPTVIAPAPEIKAHPKVLEPIAPVAGAATSIAPVHAKSLDAGPVDTTSGHTGPTPGHNAPADTVHGDPVPGDTVLGDRVAADTAPGDIVSGETVPQALAERVPSLSPLAARSLPRAAKQDTGEDGLLPQLGAPAGGGDPLGHLSSMVASMLGREPSAPEPPPSRDALPLPMRPASNVPESLGAFITELRPAGAEPRIPLTPEQRRQADPEPPLHKRVIPLPLRSPRHAPLSPLGAKLLALPAELPQAVRPSTPPWEPAPPLAPLGHYSPLEGRPLRPSIPKVQLLKKECGPRTTLPGPMLTRRLVKFTDRELRSIAPDFLRPNKRLIPGWMATALILGTLLGAGFTSVISVVRPSAEAKPPAATQASDAGAPTTPLTPAPEVSSVIAAPLAKVIEVTGFRIQMDPGKKSEIQYLVVNHSPARFSSVTVYVTLYSADAKAGQPPLCRFQFAAPNLAPFQAKDMTSTIESATRPVSLPDWQDLRASVEIGE